MGRHPEKHKVCRKDCKGIQKESRDGTEPKRGCSWHILVETEEQSGTLLAETDIEAQSLRCPGTPWAWRFPRWVRGHKLLVQINQLFKIRCKLEPEDSQHPWQLLVFSPSVQLLPVSWL